MLSNYVLFHTRINILGYSFINMAPDCIHTSQCSGNIKTLLLTASIRSLYGLYTVSIRPLDGLYVLTVPDTL